MYGHEGVFVCYRTQHKKVSKSKLKKRKTRIFTW